MKAIFVDTYKAQRQEIKKGILEVLKDTTQDNAKTVSYIVEELRSILPYVVTPQRVTAIIGYEMLGHTLNCTLYGGSRIFYIIKK